MYMLSQVSVETWSCWQLDAEVTGVYLSGTLGPIHTVGDPSIASAGRALEIIGVESKNPLLSLSHHLSFLLYSQEEFCRLSSGWWICLYSVDSIMRCMYHQPYFMFWALRQTALKARPIKYFVSNFHKE